MRKQESEHCQNCNATLSGTASDNGLYYWCFLAKDPKGKHGYSGVRLGSTISDIDEMLSEFEKEMPHLEVLGYTSIPEKHLQDERQIFVVTKGQLCLNPQLLPLF